MIVVCFQCRLLFMHQGKDWAQTWSRVKARLLMIVLQDQVSVGEDTQESYSTPLIAWPLQIPLGPHWLSTMGYNLPGHRLSPESLRVFFLLLPILNPHYQQDFSLFLPKHPVSLAFSRSSCCRTSWLVIFQENYLALIGKHLVIIFHPRPHFFITVMDPSSSISYTMHLINIKSITK